jgi:AcrR family transcriptional regulator
MGRPREHDERTAAALLSAAERIVQAEGPGALSVRSVASEVGTTTRAVYSVYGSKDGLFAALGAHAFHLLREGLEQMAPTDDPVADLVTAGLMFRRFAVEHPALFAIGVQRDVPGVPEWQPVCDAADEAWAQLAPRVERLGDRLGGRTAAQAMLQFHALCEGLATIELRGARSPLDFERLWRDGLSALIRGFVTRT